ncbi:MAG TPA: histidine phosphatase family protein [Actinomycetes bacterium]|jgi:broad specificity phosphatase PhoE|nr:histidine phosphatase family protein [Actinomycetes bacterium]
MASDDPPARPAFPRTERQDPPLYLARYLERQARGSGEGDGDDDPATPLYLRRFRERRARPDALQAPPPVMEGEPPGVTRSWADITRTKEIVPPAPADTVRVAAQIHLIRHGETQGYSTESGLTPLGGWQAHRRGFDLSKGIRDGEQVRIVCADTNRARQTAEHLHRGLLDGLDLWRRDAKVGEPQPMAEFRNFQVATPEGLRDVTSAFRIYQAVMERYERVALGDRPMWLVELDRFWNVQQGGADPIYHWLTVPMLHFEPPASCVRRFWAGFGRLVDEAPGARILCATHSGPIRAFATWALGYDPGEPYNTEEVLVKLKEGGQEALVACRNRVQEVHVPPLADLPDWWQGIVLAGRESP